MHHQLCARHGFVMSITAIVLLLISAAMHAGWNLAGKSRRPSAAFFFLASASASVCLSPLLVYNASILPAVSWRVWSLLAATTVCQTIYFGGLGAAYRRGDMSLVYPLVRSLPVLMVAFASIALGRGDMIGNVGMMGMFLVAAGCFILPMKHLSDLQLSHYMNSCCFFALVAAIGTTGYTLVDDQALRWLRTEPATALSPLHATLLFMSLQSLGTTLGLGLFTLFNANDRRRFGEIRKTGMTAAALTGVAIVVTYSLALISMAYVRDVSYVAAFRQLSIPIGVLLGVVLLRESAHWPRVLGVSVIFVGLVLVAVG